MFYVIENGMKLEIGDDNVYSYCPRCGKEQLVDISEILRNGGDLYGTAIICPKCAKLEKDLEHKAFKIASDTRERIVEGVDMDAVETMLSQDIEDLVKQYWNEYLYREENTEEGI